MTRIVLLVASLALVFILGLTLEPQGHLRAKSADEYNPTKAGLGIHMLASGFPSSQPRFSKRSCYRPNTEDQSKFPKPYCQCIRLEKPAEQER